MWKRLSDEQDIINIVTQHNVNFGLKSQSTLVRKKSIT